MKKARIVKAALSISLSAAIALAGTPAAFAANTGGHQFERMAGVGTLHTAAAQNGTKWDFASGLGIWSCTGTWTNAKDADGNARTMITPTASQDASVGEGALKLSNVQFLSGDWDEIKLGASAVNLPLTGCNSFSYDFYYDAAVKLTGCFKTKLLLTDSSGTTVAEKYLDTDTSNAAEVKIGDKTYKKVTISLPLDTLTAEKAVASIGLSIAGWHNNYQGELYLDNIAFTEKTPADAGYVAKTEQTAEQKKLNVAGLKVPHTVKTADSQAAGCAASLLALMQGTSADGQVLYGHQNDTHNKAGV